MGSNVGDARFRRSLPGPGPGLPGQTGVEVMTLRRRFGTRGTMSALAGVVAGITLPAMVFVMPVLAGESPHGGAWNIASWTNGLPSVDLPKPGNEMPALGTVLTDGSTSKAMSS